MNINQILDQVSLSTDVNFCHIYHQAERLCQTLVSVTDLAVVFRVPDFEKFTNSACKPVVFVIVAVSSTNTLSSCTEISLERHSWYLVDAFGPLHFNRWNLVDSHVGPGEDHLLRR